MATLHFDGVDDKLEFGSLVSALQTQGARSIACIFKRNETGTGQLSFFGFTNSARNDWLPGCGLANQHLEWDGGATGAPHQESTTTMTGTTDWWIGVCTKATGTATVRFHIRNLTSGSTFAHENSSGSVANPANPGSGGFFQLGCIATDFRSVDIGLAGVWTSVLSDAQVDTMDDNLRTSDWWALAPTILIECTSLTPVDLAAGSSFSSLNQATLTGATPTGWTFDGKGVTIAPGMLRRFPLGV